MGFNERDSVVQVDLDIRPTEARITRNDSHKDGPPVDIFAVREVDGKAQHLEVARDAVIANWDGPTKTLKEWALLIVDNAE